MMTTSTSPTLLPSLLLPPSTANTSLVEVVATHLSNLAKERSNNPFHDTPFSLAAQRQGYNFQGGKLDDITVLVSLVREERR